MRPDRADRAVHPRNAQTAGGHGRAGGTSPLYADARCGEAELHDYDKRLQRCF